MHRPGNIIKPPGSFFNNHGRWAWKVTLPGESTRRTIKLCPPGQALPLKVQSDNGPDAWRLAWKIYEAATGKTSSRATVADICAQWRAKVAGRLSASQAGVVALGLRYIEAQAGPRPADSVCIEDMRAVREKMREKLTRETVNKYLRVIQQCYSWAKDDGLVDPAAARLVCDFGLLPPGEPCGGKYHHVTPVDTNAVRETLAELKPTVRDMVIVQWVCDMRPGEVCIMRMADIDTTDPELWIYEPTKHKTAHIHHTHDVCVIAAVTCHAENPVAYLPSGDQPHEINITGGI